MPWSIVENHPKCAAGEWGVIKDADGSLAGCHATQADAADQLAALHIAEAGRSAPGAIEHRSFILDRVTVAEGERKLRFRGYAAIFNQRTWIGPVKGGFFEQVASGAFTRAIAEDDVRFLVDHDPAKVLARTASGTLRLREDRRGLAVDADMADVSYARDLAVLLERGDLTEMSFGFFPVTETWSVLKDGNELRTLDEVRLMDVSAVAYPAYVGTEASLRTVEARRKQATTARLAGLRKRLEAAKEW